MMFLQAKSLLTTISLEKKLISNRLKESNLKESSPEKNISKIQFEERWLWDDDKNSLQKQVISMTIAYEVYDNTGRSRGQKPIFKLVFNK